MKDQEMQQMFSMCLAVLQNGMFSETQAGDVKE
jgi:hypothetical protein